MMLLNGMDPCEYQLRMEMRQQLRSMLNKTPPELHMFATTRRTTGLSFNQCDRNAKKREFYNSTNSTNVIADSVNEHHHSEQSRGKFDWTHFCSHEFFKHNINFKTTVEIHIFLSAATIKVVADYDSI